MNLGCFAATYHATPNEYTGLTPNLLLGDKAQMKVHHLASHILKKKAPYLCHAEKSPMGRYAFTQATDQVLWSH